MHGLKSVCTRGGIQWSKPAVFACRQVSVYVICILRSDVSRSDKQYHSLPATPSVPEDFISKGNKDSLLFIRNQDH